MEREIKFEIKLKALQPINGYQVGEEIVFVNEIFNKQNGISFFPIDKEFEIIYKRQFTGLYDKNGKKII